MKIFDYFNRRKEEKPKARYVLHKDVIRPSEEAIGLLSFYVVLEKDDKFSTPEDFVKFCDDVSELVKKYGVSANGVGMTCVAVDPPIKEGGAVCATFFRDEKYAERYARWADSLLED